MLTNMKIKMKKRPSPNIINLINKIKTNIKKIIINNMIKQTIIKMGSSITMN
jgi:hypothetical protein